MREDIFIEFKNFVKSEYGIILSEEQTEKFKLYLTELILWNKKINLTSIVDEKGIIYFHFSDSLSVNIVFKQNNINTESKKLKIVDVGSGAGFPSIPLKIIYSEPSFTLIESKKKKCFFLENIKKKLELQNIEIVNMTIEHNRNINEYIGYFDISVSRALGKIGTSIKLLAPMIKQYGLLLFWITENQRTEIEFSERTLKESGLQCINYAEYKLPETIQKRYIAVLKKI